jgi:hypothetical protein
MGEKERGREGATEKDEVLYQRKPLVRSRR